MSGQPDGDVDFDLEEALGEDAEDEVGARSWSPPDSPGGVFAHGTTAAEEAEGASLTDRLAAEVPDDGYDRFGRLTEQSEGAGFEVGERRAGRLVAPDRGTAEDRDSELFAEDVGEDDGAAGAEEAAVHVVVDDEGDLEDGRGDDPA